MAKKKKRDDRKHRRPAAPTRLDLQLTEAEMLLEEGHYAEADQLLESLDRAHPTHPDVLGTRMAAAAAVGDFRLHLTLSERLARLRPYDREIRLILAGSYLSNGWPALALRTFREFLAKWPDDSEAEKVRATVAGIEAELPERLASAGLTDAAAFDHACLHEEVLTHLNAGRFADARRVAGQLLKLRPDFLPAWNNLTEVEIQEGNHAAAADACRRVLALDPDNAHARGNLVRVLFLAGRHAEAAAEAEPLKRLKPTRADGWVKLAEALSVLGGDEGVLAAADGAWAFDSDLPADCAGMLEHLAAVASYRLGREADARRRWKRAAKADPGLESARENLADLDRPVGERHAAWPFRLNHWVTRALIERFAARVGAAGKKAGAVEKAGREFLDEHPDLAALIPVLLDRGDPTGRTFAVQTALMAKTPALLAVLRDFALGQRGPDALRQQAGEAAREAGLIPAGPVRMWLAGGWHEVLLLGFEITEETTGEWSERASELVGRAIELMRRGNGAEAERLLKEALEVEPDSPSILNNLAAAARIQKRDAEADLMIRDIHRRFPDYFFGIIGVAMRAIDAGRIEEAGELLKPLLQRKKFHVSEFAALVGAEVELQLARGEKEGARSWLKMLEESAPDHHSLPALRAKIDGPGGGWWPLRRKK